MSWGVRLILFIAYFAALATDEAALRGAYRRPRRWASILTFPNRRRRGDGGP
jgi:hypothetical protein